MVNWEPFTSIWIYSHLTTSCFLFLLLTVICTMFKCASWVICLVAALAALRWTNWCLHSCCVKISDVFDVAPTNQLDFDLLSPGWGGCVSMMCWCGIREGDDNEKKWEVLRTIWSASCQKWICSSEHVRYTQHESCWVWLQVAGVSHRPTMCNESVRCFWFVDRVNMLCTTATIAWLSDINRTIFEGNDVCWCLSRIIPRILYETDPNNQVMLYGWSNYSQFIESQKRDFALFKMSKRTNLDIKDAACLHIVYILQHSTSRPTTKSMQTTMVNAPKKNFLSVLAGKYGKSTKQSTQRRHEVNEGKSCLEAETVPALGALRRLRINKKLAAEKWQETHFLRNEEKEKWIEDYVERETAGARKRVEHSEAASQQEQQDTKTDDNARLRNREPEKAFQEMIVAYRRQSEWSCKFRRWGGCGTWGWWRDRGWPAPQRWRTWLGHGHNHQNCTAEHGEVLAEADEAWRIDATGMGGCCWLIPQKR